MEGTKTLCTIRKAITASLTNDASLASSFYRWSHLYPHLLVPHDKLDEVMGGPLHSPYESLLLLNFSEIWPRLWCNHGMVQTESLCSSRLWVFQPAVTRPSERKVHVVLFKDNPTDLMSHQKFNAPAFQNKSI